MAEERRRRDTYREEKRTNPDGARAQIGTGPDTARCKGFFQVVRDVVLSVPDPRLLHGDALDALLDAVLEDVKIVYRQIGDFLV